MFQCTALHVAWIMRALILEMNRVMVAASFTVMDLPWVEEQENSEIFIYISVLGEGRVLWAQLLLNLKGSPAPLSVLFTTHLSLFAVTTIFHQWNCLKSHTVCTPVKDKSWNPILVPQQTPLETLFHTCYRTVRLRGIPPTNLTWPLFHVWFLFIS